MEREKPADRDDEGNNDKMGTAYCTRGSNLDANCFRATVQKYNSQREEARQATATSLL